MSTASILNSASSGPSGNWAKLQETLSKTTSSSTCRKGKETVRSTSGSSFKSRRDVSGIASFAHKTSVVTSESAGPSTVKQPDVAEGVVFHPMPNVNPLLVELREMVAGRNALNENRKAPGNYLGIDCEMVGLGQLGSESALARVSIVNYHGHTILDIFVAPRERVTDWRTWVSGVRESDLLGAPSFQHVQKRVAELIEGKVLVGHAIENDLKALLLNHPGPLTRDTQKCKMLRERAKTKRPGLRKLVEMELGLGIQKGAHSSITDARATMALYRIHKVEWEKQLRPTTEAWRAKTGKDKRKRDDVTVDGDEGQTATKKGKKEKVEREEFPGGGRKGISSGIGLVYRRNGKVVKMTGRQPRSNLSDHDVGGVEEGGNWWEAAPT